MDQSIKKIKDRFVIQKYIERPLLIHGRKFDIRIWCVVNELNDIYLYNEGYLRTYLYYKNAVVSLIQINSSEVFTLDINNGNKEKKQMVHLTNYVF